MHNERSANIKNVSEIKDSVNDVYVNTAVAEINWRVALLSECAVLCHNRNVAFDTTELEFRKSSNSN